MHANVGLLLVQPFFRVVCTLRVATITEWLAQQYYEKGHPNLGPVLNALSPNLISFFYVSRRFSRSVKRYPVLNALRRDHTRYPRWFKMAACNCQNRSRLIYRRSFKIALQVAPHVGEFVLSNYYYQYLGIICSNHSSHSS